MSTKFKSDYLTDFVVFITFLSILAGVGYLAYRKSLNVGIEQLDIATEGVN